VRLHQSNYLRSRLLRRHCAWICQDIKKLLLIGWSDLIDRRQNIWNGKCLIAVICSRILFRMACTFFSYIILCCFRDVSVVRTYVCSLRLQILPAFAINRLLLRALSAVFFLVNFYQLFPCLRRLVLFFYWTLCLLFSHCFVTRRVSLIDIEQLCVIVWIIIQRQSVLAKLRVYLICCKLSRSLAFWEAACRLSRF